MAIILMEMVVAQPDKERIITSDRKIVELHSILDENLLEEMVIN